MDDTCCTAYQDGIPNHTGSMEYILYDLAVFPQIDTFVYYQCFECGGLP